MANQNKTFETLKKIRTQLRTEQYRRVAEAQEAESIVLTQQEELLGEMEFLQTLRHSNQSTEHVNVDQLMSALRYGNVLNAQQAVLKEQHALLQEETAKRRLALVQADQQVKVIEKLESRIRERDMAEEQKRETQTLDEVSIQSYLRRDRL